ncbi:MAG: hypothetical protein LQ338_006051 [Usnochroma carphineum]|nr:MAG: hypothetical protein LQ338_006051 [Usnochroma carphineum]
MAADKTGSHQLQPWNHIDEGPFWNLTKRGRSWFGQRSRSPRPPNPRPLGKTGISLSNESDQRVTSARQRNLDNGSETTPLYELPGHTEEFPVELTTVEHGTYEEVKQHFRTAARRIALERREKQTLDQLERMQSDVPGIIRLRHTFPNATTELATDPPQPAELAGSSTEDGSTVISTVKSPPLQMLPLASDDESGNSFASWFQGRPPFDSQHETASQRHKKPIANCNLEGCCQADIGRVSVVSFRSATDAPPSNDSESSSIAYDTTRGSHEDRSNGSIGEFKTGDKENQETPTATHGLATTNPTSASDTDKSHACDSCFDELDRLIKVLPPRTSRRQLHRDAR